MTRINTTRKAALIAVIEAGYPAGYGPRPLARLTGFSYAYINHTARAIGLRMHDNNPSRERDPAALMTALALFHNL